MAKFITPLYQTTSKALPVNFDNVITFYKAETEGFINLKIIKRYIIVFEFGNYQISWFYDSKGERNFEYASLFNR